MVWLGNVDMGKLEGWKCDRSGGYVWKQEAKVNVEGGNLIRLECCKERDVDV